MAVGGGAVGEVSVRRSHQHVQDRRQGHSGRRMSAKGKPELLVEISVGGDRIVVFSAIEMGLDEAMVDEGPAILSHEVGAGRQLRFDADTLIDERGAVRLVRQQRQLHLKRRNLAMDLAPCQSRLVKRERSKRRN